MINTINLPPFKKMCITVGNLPTSFMESMTYYEALEWLYNYLDKTIIPAINTNSEAVSELQNAFVILKNYVDTYFDNLDIQEEINNKLDEMAESGELADIIAQYLEVASVLAFDTKASLKAAENLVNGSITKTLGNTTYNDGKGNFYKIRTLTSSDTIDDNNILALTNYPTLIAEKIRNSLDIQSEAFIKHLMALPYRYADETRELQGGCYCGDGNIACYFTSTHTIQIINIATGQVMREYQNSIFGHGNGICKIDNYLYLVGTGDSTTNNIYKIPYDTLNSYSVVNVFGSSLIPLNTAISCITYSKSKESIFISSTPVFPTLTIYEMNKEMTVLKNTYTYTNDLYTGYITNICSWNGFILVNYNYGGLQIFNENDMSLFKYININPNAGNRYYTEIEWLDAYENDLIIVGSRGVQGAGFGKGLNFFGTIDLYHSTREYPALVSKASTTNKYPKHNEVYVDSSNTSINRDGSQENPFNDLFEACNACMIDGFDETDIRLSGDFPDDGIYLECAKNVRIFSEDSNTVNTVKEIQVYSTNKLYLRDVIPTGTLTINNSDVNILYNGNLATIDLDTNMNSNLTVECLANTLAFTGVSNGKLDFIRNVSVKNLVGIYDNINQENKPMLASRYINNALQRCRLDGTAHQTGTTLKFYTPVLKPKSIYVQVNAIYVELPVTGLAKTYSISLDGGITLSVTITTDTETYDFTTLRYDLSVNTGIIYDAIVQF